MTKIAIVQKCPSNINYDKTLGLSSICDKFTVFNMSRDKVSRLLKRDVTLKINWDSDKESTEDLNLGYWDKVILVGSEAIKEFTKVTSVTDYTGRYAPGKDGSEDKFIGCLNPSMAVFKPEIKPVIEETVAAIHNLVNGSGVATYNKEYVFISPEECNGDYTQATELALAYLKKLQHAAAFGQIPILALDSETAALEARKGHMLGISISHANHTGSYIDADILDDSVIVELQHLINLVGSVVFHNAKFDLHFFRYHLNIDFSSVAVHDTMLMHYALDERQGTHGLKSLAMKYTDLGDYDRELDEFKTSYCKSHGLKQGDFSYDLIPWDIIKIYAAKDTDATIQLYNKFYPILNKNPKLAALYHDLLMPALTFLTDMEDNGVPICAERLVYAREMLQKEVQKDIDKLYGYGEIAELERKQGAPFNPNSVAQLRTLLFDMLNLPSSTRTATGALSTDKEVLMSLAEIHEIPALILRIRQNTKLINTYINKILPVLDADGKVRTGFNLSTTTSGRLSSSGNFNMQQLPRDNPLIKGAVKAKPGYKIVAVD